VEEEEEEEEELEVDMREILVLSIPIHYRHRATSWGAIRSQARSFCSWTEDCSL